MIIFKSINRLNKEVNFKANIGFVPTMGSLHKGHISLIKSSKNICKKTLVSIFINPSQFNKKNDLKNYPRNLKKDMNILKKLKVDYLLIPRIKDIYKNKKSTKIKLNKKDKIMCAFHRPGHFEGVLAVINQFLINLKPKYIFLGQKDFQQAYLIKKFVKKKFKIKIIVCKTLRNNQKLALSSRLNLLSKQEIKKAEIATGIFYKFFKSLKKNLKLQSKINYIKNTANNYGIKIDYLELRNKLNLSKKFNKSNFKLFYAFYVGKVRLIDNF